MCGIFLKIVTKEYHRTKPSTSVVYNQKRTPGSPSWKTISRLFGVTKWVEWLDYCGIDPNKVLREEIKITSTLTATNGNNRKYTLTKNQNGDIAFQDVEFAP